MPQKYHLNMNPLCSAYLCVNEWCRHMGLFTKHILWSASDTSNVFRLCCLNIWVHEHMNIISRTALSHSMSILPFLLSKTIVISYTNRNLRSSQQPVKIKVWFKLKKLWQKYYLKWSSDATCTFTSCLNWNVFFCFFYLVKSFPLSQIEPISDACLCDVTQT